MPKTDSIQKLATFWQRHDVTDFEDDLEEVPRPVFQRAYVVGVPLSGDEHQAVRSAAASRGLERGSVDPRMDQRKAAPRVGPSNITLERTAGSHALAAAAQRDR